MNDKEMQQDKRKRNMTEITEKKKKRRQKGRISFQDHRPSGNLSRVNGGRPTFPATEAGRIRCWFERCLNNGITYDFRFPENDAYDRSRGLCGHQRNVEWQNKFKTLGQFNLVDPGYESNSASLILGSAEHNMNPINPVKNYFSPLLGIIWALGSQLSALEN